MSVRSLLTRRSTGPEKWLPIPTIPTGRAPFEMRKSSKSRDAPQPDSLNLLCLQSYRDYKVGLGGVTDVVHRDVRGGLTQNQPSWLDVDDRKISDDALNTALTG